MELFILILLLTAAGGNDAQAAMRSLLSFYRENRDLIRAIAQSAAPMSEGSPPKTDPLEKEQEKGPRNEVPSDLLEAYLKRLA